MKKILLMDATNNFIRNYAVIPTMTNDGEPNGGVFGFIRTLGFVARTMFPDEIILVWDGVGGSQKRKAINKDYKEGRKPIRLNRNFDHEMIDVQKNKIKQRLRLAEYLPYLPVHEITIDNVEADDVIAYLTQYYSDDETIIVSNDKDFLQLVSDKTKIYKRGKDDWKVLDIDDVFKIYDIYPKNIALARAIVGDTSDNIKGIKGIGMKTLKKLFPFISEIDKVTVNQILTFSEEALEKDKKAKKYKTFLESKSLIINNLRMMQLTEPIISPVSITKIKQSLQKDLSFSAHNFRIKLHQDGIQTIGSSFFKPFSEMYKGRQDGQ